jgi:hypothetical protein
MSEPLTTVAWNSTVGVLRIAVAFYPGSVEMCVINAARDYYETGVSPLSVTPKCTTRYGGVAQSCLFSFWVYRLVLGPAPQLRLF